MEKTIVSTRLRNEFARALKLKAKQKKTNISALVEEYLEEIAVLKGLEIKESWANNGRFESRGRLTEEDLTPLS